MGPNVLPQETQNQRKHDSFRMFSYKLYHGAKMFVFVMITVAYINCQLKDGVT